jgi:hypothetical protein
MWFAALGRVEHNPWFQNLAVRLLQNKAEVTRLLAHNPFPNAPPRYVRAMLYDYRFTSREEHGQTGAWWKRRELREYFPEASLQSDR